MKRAAEVVLLCAAVALLMGADSASARYQKLGDKIMCTCGCAQMLLKCNHVGCPNSDRMISQLRALTGVTSGGQGSDGSNLQMLSSDEDVLNWFRRTWGVTAVVEPGTHGLEMWAWVLPPAALGLGLLLVVFTVRRWKSRPAPVSGPHIEADPQLEAFRARARRETEI